MYKAVTKETYRARPLLAPCYTSLSQKREVKNLVVVVQADLAMQLVGSTQHATLVICNAVADAPQASMCCRHCTHCTGLSHHVAIKASTEIGPAQQHEKVSDCDGLM